MYVLYSVCDILYTLKLAYQIFDYLLNAQLQTFNSVMYCNLVDLFKEQNKNILRLSEILPVLKKKKNKIRTALLLTYERLLG